ncbi:MFS transporter [Rhizorhabdus argentea]|uniref:MFS transporter n=1 Tax=Rhizorhabdus argentea TaxID=1387174 RepID=UPI0030EC6C6B
MTAAVVEPQRDAFVFAPEERPSFPGAPYTPPHPGWRRAGYATIGLLSGVGSNLGNSLITVNISDIAGGLGLYVYQASLLPAFYVAFIASANLILVRGRVQFGIAASTQAALTAYLVAGAIQLLFPGFPTALLVRAAAGFAGAALVTFAIFNFMQIVRPKARPVAVVLAISSTQLGQPLARLFPVETLARTHWHALHLVELAIPLTLLAASRLLPLPPSDRMRWLRRDDFATFALVLVGMLLACSVLAEGRLLWWTETPWLGVALALSVPCFALAILVERRRKRPALQLHWLGSVEILRFAAVALLVRLALAEQTYGAVGLLTSGGLTNDQLRLLFLMVAAAMALGSATAVLTLSEKSPRYQVMVAALLIALGAWIDTDATNVTRPPQLYLSQTLIAFGTTLFIGPALVLGFRKLFQQGADYLVSFIFLFNSTQNIGGLVGSALLGTYQVICTRYHAATLSERLLAGDPQVATRIEAGRQALAGSIVDPGMQAAQGSGLLAQALAREATILAYNDVFRLVCLLALLTAAFVAAIILGSAAQDRRARAHALPA